MVGDRLSTGVYQIARVAKTSNTTTSSGFVRCRSHARISPRASSHLEAVLERTARNAVFEEENRDEKVKQNKKKKIRSQGWIFLSLSDSCANARNSFPAVSFSLFKTAVHRGRSDYFRSLNFGHEFSLTFALSCNIYWRPMKRDSRHSREE